MRLNLRLVVAVGSLAVVLTACSPLLGGDPASPSPAAQESGKVMSVPEAVTAERDAAEVRGYILFGSDQVMRLCTGLAGSFPPQCGLPAITVKGLNTDDIPGAESDQGIIWSGETTLRGSLSGGVLTVG